jgi:hypothetical protein
MDRADTHLIVLCKYCHGFASRMSFSDPASFPCIKNRLSSKQDPPSLCPLDTFIAPGPDQLAFKLSNAPHDGKN